MAAKYRCSDLSDVRICLAVVGRRW